MWSWSLLDTASRMTLARPAFVLWRWPSHLASTGVANIQATPSGPGVQYSNKNEMKNSFKSHWDGAKKFELLILSSSGGLEYSKKSLSVPMLVITVRVRRSQFRYSTSGCAALNSALFAFVSTPAHLNNHTSSKWYLWFPLFFSLLTIWQSLHS